MRLCRYQGPHGSISVSLATGSAGLKCRDDSVVKDVESKCCHLLLGHFAVTVLVDVGHPSEKLLLSLLGSDTWG